MTAGWWGWWCRGWRRAVFMLRLNNHCRALRTWHNSFINQSSSSSSSSGNQDVFSFKNRKYLRTNSQQSLIYQVLDKYSVSPRSPGGFTLSYPGCVTAVWSCAPQGFPSFVWLSDGVQYGVDHRWLGWVIRPDCVVLTPTHQHACTPTGTFCCNESFFFFMLWHQSLIKSLSIHLALYLTGFAVPSCIPV